MKIHGRMVVKTLKKEFKEEFGLSIRLYNNNVFADENATLASIRKNDSTGGEFSPGKNTKVGNLEDKFMEIFGIKIQIAGSDDSYLCNNDLTLAGALEFDEKKLAKQKKKALITNTSEEISSESKENNDEASMETYILKNFNIGTVNEDSEDLWDCLTPGVGVLYDEYEENFYVQKNEQSSIERFDNMDSALILVAEGIIENNHLDLKTEYVLKLLTAALYEESSEMDSIIESEGGEIIFSYEGELDQEWDGSLFGMVQIGEINCMVKKNCVELENGDTIAPIDELLGYCDDVEAIAAIHSN